jgi:hypothetical protein
MKRCSVEGCDRKYLCRDFCGYHYDKAKRSGALQVKKRQPRQHGTLTMYGNGGCRCVECKAALAAYSRQNKAKRRETDREKWSRSLHAMNLKKLYGVSLDQYEAMLVAQDSKCAICKEPAGLGARQRLCVDHNHETGAVRGLLCFRCNSAIGMLKDDPQMVRRAYTYLLKHLFRPDAA